MGEPSGAVAVIAAMVPELRPIVRKLRLRSTTIGDFPAHEGTARGRPVVGLVTSMGTEAATAATKALLAHRSIERVIVVGICGGMDPGLRIGALVIPTETMIEATGRIGVPRPPAGHQPAGRLLTTDTLHTDPDVVAGFHVDGFVAVDMESGAIGAVCDDADVPWTVIRAVSDRAGDPTVDPELVAMSNADGTPQGRAVTRYVLRHPARLPKLAALGRGMRTAVGASSKAALRDLR